MKSAIFLLSILSIVSAFIAPSQNAASSALHLGFLDGVFGGPKSATASHILLKGPNANTQCEKLKVDIYKKAIGRGNPADGVEAEKLIRSFGQVARSKSTCPSKSNGGDLGTFGPGEMVPEFDSVAFKAPVGVIHGPVETQFGSHLILITDRE